MARVPRSFLPDGLFHVATRGVARMTIYRDNDDRLVFLGLLAQAVERYEWTCHTYCLMTTTTTWSSTPPGRTFPMASRC